MEDPDEHAPSPLGTPESPPEPDERMGGGQRAAAAVRTMHPPLSGKNLRPNNTENICYHQQRPGPLSGVRKEWILSGIETPGCWHIQVAV